MNRLANYFAEPPDPTWQEDYHQVETYHDTFVVSHATALQVERWLDGLPTPAWIVFHDLAGSRHRVLAAHIYRISENTAAQRACRRAFRRGMRQEEKADRRPEDDDDY
jgi:hypothetical protein